MQSEILQPEAIKHIDDRELLRRFSLDDDEEAFAEIVHRYERLVMSVCRRSIGSGPEADDAFQATFLTLARKPKQIRKIESLSSWLYSVAWRISARLVRARRKNPVQPLPEEQAAASNDPLQQIAAHQHATILDEELQTLPDKYRDVLVMTYFAEQTSQQIASQLDVSKGTVDGRIRQARNMLRVKLARRGVGVGVLLAAATLMKAETAAAAPSVVSGTIAIGSQTISQSLPETTDLSHLEPLVRPEITSMIGTKSLLSTVVGVCALAGFAGMGNGHNEGEARNSPPSTAVVETQQESGSEAELTATVEVEEPKPSEPVDVSIAQAPAAITSDAGLPGTISTTTSSSTTTTYTPYPEDALPTEKWLYETLDKSIEPMSFREGSTLAEVLADIAKKYPTADGGPMRIWPDSIALSDVQITNLEDVSLDKDIQLSEVTLASAMKLILGSLDGVDEPLDVMIKNEVLMVTTRSEAEAEENYFIRTYEVANLMNLQIGDFRPVQRSPGGGGGGGVFSVASGTQMGGQLGGRGMPTPQPAPSLVSVVMDMTSPPGLWQEIDGEGGTIALVGTKLVVRQNAAVHREIVKLLNLLAP